MNPLHLKEITNYISGTIPMNNIDYYTEAHPEILKILYRVCDLKKTSPAVICSKEKNRTVTYIRKLYCYVARMEGYDRGVIASPIGVTDGAVSQAVESVRDWSRTDPQVREDIKILLGEEKKAA